MSIETEKKIRKCFQKLFYVCRGHDKCLSDVFEVFDDANKGYLDQEEFQNMIKYFSQNISEAEINAAFDHIDKNRNRKIYFDDLNNYFSKVNGIPEHLNKPQDSRYSYQQPVNFFHQMLNPGYIPHYNQNYQGNLELYPQQYYPLQYAPSQGSMNSHFRAISPSPKKNSGRWP